MKTFILIFIHLASAVMLFIGSCSHSAKNKLKGEWKSKDGSTRLKISSDKFTEDTGTPVTEDYFMKGDTIYTSFEGNQPFTKFVVLKVDDHNLNLLYPDSISIAFVRQ
ncbi:hypothetical protein [Mucilaginibacter boryungensis]|uniref:DUF5640 domain-containing protein n=1 Tax=Mucilaginibacter boryungensis TaxID=768480 RepID=A0ABR9XCQ4_9SPHI|nr:hypothetical protein [Mucilaginibacter boryungensis]MBE9664965.1 hypothetical protein [Mucilaginibacter boryungensis]